MGTIHELQLTGPDLSHTFWACHIPVFPMTVSGRRNNINRNGKEESAYLNGRANPTDLRH